MSRRIFYSWQSDSAAETNRGFIGDCLSDAIKAIHAETTISESLSIDRDTLDERGSPEIARTLLAKIEQCDAFVADVTIINPDAPSSSRRTPNPNVLLELGFAARARGWERVICVCNLASGAETELPFDLRHRRVVGYSLQAGAKNRAPTRRKLAADLADRLREVLSGNAAILRRELTAFFDDIDPSIMPLIRQGTRSLSVQVPASHAQQLQALASDPAFSALAAFRDTASFAWTDARGPTNGFVVTVTDAFVGGTI